MLRQVSESFVNNQTSQFWNVTLKTLIAWADLLEETSALMQAKHWVACHFEVRNKV